MNKLKAGEYFIGDPCYVVKDELWGEYCDKSFEFQVGGVFTIQGAEVFYSSTMYGDGCYYDDNWNDYPVDAGIIGATPLDKGITVDEIRDDLGVIVEMHEDFTCEIRNDRGEIIIDDIVIYTGD